MKSLKPEPNSIQKVPIAAAYRSGNNNNNMMIRTTTTAISNSTKINQTLIFSPSHLRVKPERVFSEFNHICVGGGRQQRPKDKRLRPIGNTAVGIQTGANVLNA